jgi:hypothetical protein
MVNFKSKMIKNLNFIILFILFTLKLSAQSPAEKAYLEIVNHGNGSNAPYYIVVTIISANTNESKEMILEINDLFRCINMEKKEPDAKKFKGYLLSKSFDRTFILSSREALDFIEFEKYDSRNAQLVDKEIEDLVLENHLIDSLPKKDSINSQIQKLENDYYYFRKDVAEKISDSIAKVRPVTKTEQKALEDLHTDFWDNNEASFSQPPFSDKSDTAMREQLLKIWNSKIKDYRSHYKIELVSMFNELARWRSKFLETYLDKYGLNFCKVLIRVVYQFEFILFLMLDKFN